MSLLLSFLLSLLAALGLGYAAVPLARRAGMMDHPDPRKVHRVPTPRAGGLIIFPIAVGGLVAGWWGQHPFTHLLLSLALVFAVGVWDDWKGAHYSTKFFAQTTAALIAVAGGVKVSPFGNDLLNTVLSVGWLVGITNAVNLIDGLDGLAAGLSVNALLSIGALAAVSGNHPAALFCLALGGGVLGFLRVNLTPARAFLGDSGSLVLGFSIAALSILHASKTATFLILAIPVLFIAIPMVDTLLAFSRRISRGAHPFKPDKEHLHHVLLSLHFTPQQILGYFYLFSTLLGLASFAFAQTHNIHALTLSLLLLIAMIVVVRWLDLFNFHQAISGINDLLQEVRRRMRAPEESGRRIALLRAFLLIAFLFDLAVAAASPGAVGALLATAALLTAAACIPDLAALPRSRKEHSFPWLAMGTILLLFSGQMALAAGRAAEDGLLDNLVLLLVLVGVLAGVAAYLFLRRKLEAFLIHPLIIPVLYACALAGGVAKHLGAVAGFLPLVVALGNTVVAFGAVVIFSRRVLFAPSLLNLLGFLAILGLTSACWFI